MQQLSLFEEAPVDDIPEGYMRVPEVGQTMEYNLSCMNPVYNASPGFLARWAEQCLMPAHSQITRKATNKDLLFFRNIEARVEGDHIKVVSVRIETPSMFARRHDHEKENNIDETDGI